MKLLVISLKLSTLSSSARRRERKFSLKIVVQPLICALSIERFVFMSRLEYLIDGQENLSLLSRIFSLRKNGKFSCSNFLSSVFLPLFFAIFYILFLSIMNSIRYYLFITSLHIKFKRSCHFQFIVCANEKKKKRQKKQFTSLSNSRIIDCFWRIIHRNLNRIIVIEAESRSSKKLYCFRLLLTALDAVKRIIRRRNLTHSSSSSSLHLTQTLFTSLHLLKSISIQNAIHNIIIRHFSTFNPLSFS